VKTMRDLSVDDGFGLPEVEGDLGDVEVHGLDVEGVNELAVDGLDVGFDFRSDVDGSPGANGAPEDGSSPADGMTDQDVADFRARWADIQASFIDDPHRACEHADNLVDLVLQRLTERFARERKDLVRAWDRGNEPADTENLRVTIKGYRGLVDRLLTTRL